MREERRYAWITFAGFASQRHVVAPKSAATTADELLKEYDARFGPVTCPECKGAKTVPGPQGSPHADTDAERVPVTCRECFGRGVVDREDTAPGT